MTTIHWSVAASARLRQATRLIDKTQQAIAEQHWGWLRRHALRGRYPVVLPTVGLEGAYQQTHTWRVWPAGPLDVVVQSHHQPLLLQQPVEYANGTIHRWILWWTNGQWQIGV
ncbi:hypothetical protein TPY_2700 [Sulfobacillus acidophilus TPY]|nr:hypothetical protein TPY_2700 [Sulfobacillus acidophilus TPY]